MNGLAPGPIHRSTYTPSAVDHFADLYNLGVFESPFCVNSRGFVASSTRCFILCCESTSYSLSLGKQVTALCQFTGGRAQISLTSKARSVWITGQRNAESFTTLHGILKHPATLLAPQASSIFQETPY